mgnify:CR=1 FL=1
MCRKIVENLIEGTAKRSNFMSSLQEDLEMAWLAYVLTEFSFLTEFLHFLILSWKVTMCRYDRGRLVVYPLG